MNLSELTIRLLVLFLPGILSVIVVDALTIHSARSTFRFVLHSYLFGVIAYAVYWGLAQISMLLFGWPNAVAILRALANQNAEIELPEVAVTTALAVPVAFLYSYAANHSWLHRIAAFLRVSNRFGDHDVWGLAFNSPDLKWVAVRDIRNNLVIQGYAYAFSDTEKPRELLIQDAIVYKNDSGERLYSIPAIYISRPDGEWTIEFPVPEPEVVERLKKGDEKSDED
jgi:hypothetical protein